MRTLSIDWGMKGIGFCVTDNLKISINPVLNYFFKNRYNFKEAYNEIEKIIKKYNNEIDTIVIGYPMFNTENNSYSKNKVDNFYDMLSKKLESNIKVVLFTEFKSTSEAKTNLNNKDFKKNKDMYSSCIILKNYLNK